MAAVVVFQPLAQHPVGDFLQIGIEGRAHREPALVKPLLAVAGDQFAADFLGEVIGADEGDLVALAHRERLGPRLARVLGADHAVFQHAPDRPVAARLGGFGKADRMIVVGRLGQRGEIGGLGHA